MRSSFLLLPAALALFTTACAPSLPVLIAAGRYDEVLCTNDDGTYPGHDDPSVILAIESILRPTVKLHAVTPEEIDHVFADATPDIKARAREAGKRVFMVHRHIESHPTPVHRASASVSVKNDGKWVDDIGYEEKLAEALHEEIPKSHQEGPGALDSVAAWGKDVGEHPIANALTFGIWSALTGPSATSHSVPPTKEDYQRMAPITVGLLHAFPGWSCDDRAGVVCESTDYHLRPKDEGNAPISVEFNVHADMELPGGVFTNARRCNANRTVIVDLPTGGTIEERIALTFGDTTRSFSELDGLKRHGAPKP